MPTTAKPSGPPTIRMYNVGFGDCFLLSFPYTKAKGGGRHLLIDFGSFPKPKGAPKGFMEDIANDIKARCQGGRLAVVATHRHADHINGFTTSAKGTASGDIIRALKPELVVQPWTEDPDAAQDAHKPALRQAALAFHKSLAAMQSFAAALVPRLERLPAFVPRDLRDRLAFTGEDAVKNVKAVKNLMTMGKRKAQYVHAGTASGLETFLPGVTIHVLGPPTLAEEPDIGSYAKKSPEYWLRRRQIALQAGGPGRGRAADRPPFPGAERRPKGRFPAHAAWFIARLRQAYADELLGIVTELDDVMNNTSIILLVEVAGQKLLFPGDAQLENWTYALRQYRKLLDGVTVYKVGHHGSLNATPKTLWRIMTEADTAVPTARFKTLMSTLRDVHGGKTGLPTEVPRGPLVDDLKHKSKLTTTLDHDDFGKAQVVPL
jgi:hypothetical protein